MGALEEGWLGGALALALWTGALLSVAALTAPGRRRPLAAAIAALVALNAAWLIPANQILPRFALTAMGVAVLGRAFDLARRDSTLDFWGRVWLLVAVFDVREARRCEPSVPREERRWQLIHLALAAAGGLASFWLAEEIAGPSHWALRWAGGALLLYGVVE